MPRERLVQAWFWQLHSSQRLGAAQKPTARKMDKQIVVRASKGTLTSKKKNKSHNRATITCNNVDKPSLWEEFTRAGLGERCEACWRMKGLGAGGDQAALNRFSRFQTAPPNVSADSGVPTSPQGVQWCGNSRPPPLPSTTLCSRALVFPGACCAGRPGSTSLWDPARLRHLTPAQGD